MYGYNNAKYRQLCATCVTEALCQRKALTTLRAEGNPTLVNLTLKHVSLAELVTARFGSLSWRPSPSPKQAVIHKR